MNISASTGMFGALLSGASLHLLDIKAEGLAFMASWLAQQQVTLYHSVPTAFRHFSETLTGDESFPHLRCIVLGGEPVFRRDVQLYRQYFSPNYLLVNHLGSTELGAMRAYFVDYETRIDDHVVPVGYAMPGVEFLVLDEAGKEVGAQQIGELAVKSRYISPGYWRLDELTRTVFLPDPADAGQRVYRTGDLGYLRPDGCLVHLGRKDFQVKIRGQRIEVAEIERALLDVAGVKEAVVVARQDQPDDPRLMAYVVRDRERLPAISELRRSLGQRLPDYMLPSAFIFLDALPLTPTGKVDYQALPPPGTMRPHLTNPFVAPRTPVEAALAGIWAEVLGLEHVGVLDNFLDLGGHSLLAAQIVTRVYRAWQVEVPLRLLLEAPTVAEMAVVITQGQAGKAAPHVVEQMLAELEALTDAQVRQQLPTSPRP